MATTGWGLRYLFALSVKIWMSAPLDGTLCRSVSVAKNFALRPLFVHGLVLGSPDHSSFHLIWQDKPCPMEDKKQKKLKLLERVNGREWKPLKRGW